MFVPVRIWRPIRAATSVLMIGAVCLPIAPLYAQAPAGQSPSASPTLLPALQARGMQPAYTGLEIAADPQVILASPTIGRFDAGSFSILDKSQVEHIFTLRNTGKTPVTLKELKPSCGCSSAYITGGKPGTSLPTLAPGGKANVRFDVDLTQVHPGPVNKFLSVYVKGQRSPAALIEIKGTMTPSAILNPPFLYLGQVPFGQKSEQIVTLTYDDRGVPPGARPEMLCPSPSIHVEAVTDAVGADPDRNVSSLSDPKHAVTQRYRVTLQPDTPIGLLMTNLNFAPIRTQTAPNSDANQASNSSLVPLELRNLSVTLSATIVGDIHALPGEVIFNSNGSAPLSAQQVILVGHSEETFKNIRITSDSAFITVREPQKGEPGAPSPVRTGPPTKIIEVALAPHAPVGLNKAHVMITLENGQILKIPVSAYVTAAP